MGVIFVAIGWLQGLIGGLYVAAILRANASGAEFDLATVIAVLPGFSIIASGLIFWAIGIALSHLARIERNTADVADMVESALASQGLLPRKGR